MICVILYTLVQVGLSLATLKLSWLERSKDQSEKGSVIARELLHSTTRLTETSEKKAASLRELLYVPMEESTRCSDSAQSLMESLAASSGDEIGLIDGWCRCQT